MSLQCCAVSCARNGRTLFADISFTVAAGQALRLVGENGSGKSTLLRILCGLRSPDTGTVMWRDLDIASNQTDFRQELIFIGHALGVKEHLTALENLKYSNVATGDNIETLAQEALECTGLASKANMQVRFLSQGQKRRVALAQLHLSASRRLWMLDEPFVGLDASAARSLACTMEAHLARGGSIVFTTHQDIGPEAASTLTLGAP